MPAALRLATVLLCLTVVNLGCSSDGSSSGSSGDSEKSMIEARRAAWPATNGEFSDRVDLSGYTVLTLVPFENLTDNSREDDAGDELVQEIEDTIADRYEGVFATVRIADAPLGQADEIVATGFVYDFSKGGGYNYWTGRNKGKFKAMMALKNGATGEVVKSSRINQTGYGSNDELMEEAAEKFARMLKRSLGAE